jgi:hypothetical protein
VKAWFGSRPDVAAVTPGVRGGRSTSRDATGTRGFPATETPDSPVSQPVNKPDVGVRSELEFEAEQEQAFSILVGAPVWGREEPRRARAHHDYDIHCQH